VRACAAVLAIGAASACASGSGGSLGDVLGAVLGGGAGGAGQQQQGQVQGVVRGVDTRNQQISLQLTNGQTVGLGYDQQTQVIYQNRSYAVTNLESGDQVTVTVRDNGNGNYYVSTVQVDQSVQGGGGTVNGGSGTTNGGNSVQSIQGTVQQVDLQNGLFSIDVGNRSVYTVSLPYNVSRADSDRFRSLRQGDRVRFYGVPLNNTRIELRQFY
jgi:hypothetical protein